MVSVSGDDEQGAVAPDSVTVLLLEERGGVPNNLRLPVIVYRGAFEPTGDAVVTIEARFEQNGWPPQWRDGIYDFHHYHAEGHEVFAIAKGEAELMLGGGGGRKIALRTSDALLLSAGTGHCLIDASDDLLVVGAYPPGQHGDIRREPPTADVRLKIAGLYFPPSDPVFGADGPLFRHWSDAVGAMAR
jgi:uncharacterized protein YjlB